MIKGSGVQPGGKKKEKRHMSYEQDAPTYETSQVRPEKKLNYPILFADHSLECPPEYKQLRQECPVARISAPHGGDAYLLTRHADISKALNDERCDTVHYSDGDVPRISLGGNTDPGDTSLFGMSNSRHNKVRRLVTRAFTVQHARELRPLVEEVTNSLIDAMEQAGPSADLFEDYAIQVPMTIICELLGVPRQDEKLFRQWARAMLSTKYTAEEQIAQRKQIFQYLTSLIEHAPRRDDVISMFIDAREQGGDVVLTNAEMLSFASTLIVAGFETVSTTFTNSAFILLQRPDVLAQLKERINEPERLAAAIEEILRITPTSSGGTTRITREEIEFSGTTVPPGEVLFFARPSANRDESVFPHPDEIDFDREANPILSFGRGIHVCLGQQLARMELQVLWSTLLKRLPTIRLAVAPSEVPWRPDETLTFGPASLPVTW